MFPLSLFSRKFTTTSFLGVASVAVMVAVIDWLSLVLTRKLDHVATIWPAYGIVLAICLLGSVRASRRVLIAAALGAVAAMLAFGDPPLIALALAAIDTSGMAIAYLLVRRFIGPSIDFREWESLTVFLGATFAASILAGAMGATVFRFAMGVSFFGNWTLWSLAGGVSYAIFTPPIVLFATMGKNAPRYKKRKVAACSLAALAVSIAVFGQSSYPATFVVPITLLGVTLVAEIEATVVSLLLTTCVALAFTTLGRGPAALLHGAVAHHILLVQIFLAAMITGMLPAAAAITERRIFRDGLAHALKQAEAAGAALRESEARYRLLADNSTDVIVRAGRNGKLLYVSPACRALGYEPADLMNVDSASFVHPDDLASFNASTAELFSGRPVDKTRMREHRFKTKSGEWVWLQGNPSILRDDDGSPREFVNVFRNVTARRKADETLAAALSVAEDAARAKAEFLANMSHELRTPLTSVIGFTDLLHDSCELAEQPRRYAARVRAASRALLSTVNDILDFSKLENGQIELAPEPLDIGQHAEEVFELFSAQAQSKKIAFDLKIAPAVSEIPNLIDPHRLRQVLLNLVGNAVKFTDVGSVTLRIGSVGVREAAPEQRTLRFEIEDTGLGIAEDQLDLLFQRFSQVDRSTSRRFGGSGLGLAICKGIVEGMGGRIGVSTKLGTGSIFWFEIPALASRGVENSTERRCDTDPKLRAKILVVDDTDANRILVRTALGRTHADVIEAESGERAIELARAGRFDLILMDIHMPRMNGISAMRAIRRQGGPSSRALIVAFTAEGDAMRLAALRDEGFDGTLAKPIVIADLISCVVKSLAAEPSNSNGMSCHVA